MNKSKLLYNSALGCFFFFLKTLLILLGISIISGCGFCLQGCHNYKASPDLKNLKIITNDYNNHFILQILDYFQSVGFIVNTSNNSDQDLITKECFSTLKINTPEIKEHIGGYDIKKQIRQVIIIITLKYQLIDKNGQIIKENTILRSNIYSLEPNKESSNINAKKVVTEELKASIIEELIKEITLCN